MREEGVRCESRTAPWAGAHPGKVMTFRDWGRGRLPHLGAGADPRGRHLLRWGKGGGVSPRSGTRCSRTPRTPRPVLQTVDRDSISRSPPPLPPNPSRLLSPHRRSPLPAATGAPAEPGPASGGGGRTARYSHPRRLSPPPAASAAAAGALCCSGRAAATERARAPVAPVTATPPGAARCAAVRIPSRPPPAARPRRRSLAEEKRLVATSPRSPDTPARRPGLGLQQEGGRLDSLVEEREGGGEELWLGLTFGPFPGSSSLYPSPKVLVTPTFLALSLLSAAPFCPFNPSMT